MALKATIFKANLHIADMDRHHYDSYQLTLARHPSETDKRMMARLAVFALNAHPQLSFTKGISTKDEPDLWLRTDSGEILSWIELGQPEEKRLRQACGSAGNVTLYCYHDRAASVWWNQMQANVQRFNNLKIVQFSDDSLLLLETICQKNMNLHCTIQDGTLSISDEHYNVDIFPAQLYPPKN